MYIRLRHIANRHHIVECYNLGLELADTVSAVDDFERLSIRTLLLEQAEKDIGFGKNMPVLVIHTIFSILSNTFDKIPD